VNDYVRREAQQERYRIVRGWLIEFGVWTLIGWAVWEIAKRWAA
jgi:hypothetical protein